MAARRLPPRAPGVEPAAAGRRRRRGQVTGEQDPLPLVLDLRVRHRHRGEQGAGVRVLRVVVERLRRRLLDQPAQVHHQGVLQLQKLIRDRVASSRDVADVPASYKAVYPGREADARDIYRGEAAVGWGPARYVPFVEWTRAPYTSRLVNVGPEGLRRTCFNSEIPHATKVWVFGGSTVWGSGAADCETLPSHLSKVLNAYGPHVVTNYGEGGYVSSQSLIRFLVLLRNGLRPDVVIFYEGFNDTWIATYARAGTHQDEARMRRVLEAGPWMRTANGLRAAIDRDYLTLYYAKRLLGFSPPTAEKSWLRPSDIDLANELSKGLDMYLENAAMARAVGALHQFPVHSFWQPTLANKTPLSEPEVDRMHSMPADFRSALNVAGNMVSTRGSGEGIVDLQGVFQNVAAPLFIDAVHISGEGNRLLANAVVDSLRAND